MLSCPICGKECKSDTSLMAHTEAKHGKSGVHRGVTAWERSRGQQNLMTTGAEVQDGKVEVSIHCKTANGNWECPFCYKVFYRHSGLDQHINSGVHSEKAYKCDDCGRKFAKMAQLVSHTSNSTCRYVAHAAATLVNDYKRGSGPLMLTNGGEPTYEATLYFDGSAKPNPGEGGLGFVLHGIYDELDRGSCSVREYGVTNNEAEWMALIIGLRSAKKYYVKTLKIKGDSELVLKQMEGTYRVNSGLLMRYYNEAKSLQRDFLRCTFEHVTRDLNSEADFLAGKAANGYEDYSISKYDCM